MWETLDTWIDVFSHSGATSLYRRDVRACRRTQLDELMHTGTDVAYFAYPGGCISGTLDHMGVLRTACGDTWPCAPSLTCFLLRPQLPSLGDIIKSQTDHYIWTIVHTPHGKFILQRCRWNVDLAPIRKREYRRRLENGISPAGLIRLLRKWRIHAIWCRTGECDVNKKIRYPYGVLGSSSTSG